MKDSFSVSISYPPLDSQKGSAFLSQNRQFQWSHTGNIIYPVIPAYAATLLAQHGYRVSWDDGIAEKINYSAWLDRINKLKPDVLVIETKTPVIKLHWQIINEVKNIIPDTIIALMGDHVTALPEESLNNSKVDYVITGGDYDFMLLNLADHLTKGTTLEPGFYYRTKAGITNSGGFALKHHNLDLLPIIDRDLTRWQLYAYNNTNYKFKPGAYIMSGRDCWWGRCTFCSWTTLFPGRNYRRFSTDHTIREVENLVNNYKVREIFDDAGTLPVGDWLKDLCDKLIDKGLSRKVKLSCNMRFSALSDKDYLLLSKAGFRFILYGLESANPDTLKKINKNISLKQISSELKTAKKYNLEPHITIMIGYPWEDKKMALKTLNFAKGLFKQGAVDSMQATLVIPYPGTPLFDYCDKRNLLLTKDWDKYDMRQVIIKSPVSETDQKQIIQSLFKGIITPKFIINRIKSIRSLSDIKFLFTYTLKFFQKLRDFF